MSIRRREFLSLMGGLAVSGAWPRKAHALSPFDGLGENAWVDLTPTMPFRIADRTHLTADPATTHYYPGGRPDAMQSPVTRGFSRLVVGADAAWEFGGGHSSHPGNDVDRYDPALNGWEMQYPPDIPEPTSVASQKVRSGTPNAALSPNGRPWCHHTYQTVVDDPTRGRLLLVFLGGVMAYDKTSRAWTKLTAAWWPRWGLGSSMVVRDGDDLVAFVGQPVGGAPQPGTARGVYRCPIANLEAPTNPWTLVEGLPSGFFPGPHIYGDVDPIGRVAYIYSRLGSGSTVTWRAYDLTATGPGGFTNLPHDAILIPAVSNVDPIFSFDTNAGVVVVLTQSSNSPVLAAQLKTYDPAAQAWAALPIVGGPTGGKATMDGRLGYLSAHNVHLHVQPMTQYSPDGPSSGGDTKTWAFRLAL